MKASTGKQRQHVPESPLDRAHGSEVVWASVAEIFHLTRGVRGASYVYCIGEEGDGAIKIGVAVDPIKRLRQMQTGNPRRLCVERVLLGDRALEQLLHEMWEPAAIPSVRSRGKLEAAPGTEWFAPEIRKQLFPILDTAVAAQARYVERTLSEGDDIQPEELERALRKAVDAHGFIPHRRKGVRLLAQGSGYAVTRPSRV
jgi:hypothetical protein